MAKKKTEQEKSVTEELNDFLELTPPPVPRILDNVLLVFLKNIPEDAKEYCVLESGGAYPGNIDEIKERRHLMKFVQERLDLIAKREYALWLNGRLPFITPRELLVWRLRQFIEHIWAFQLPDDDDLALIFNTTKMKAAHLSADFMARFRKSLLFPIALRRLYRILRGEDEHYHLVDLEYEHKKAYGSTFLLPSTRYVQYINALIEEFRLREHGFLREAELISKEDNLVWVSERVIVLAKDDEILHELLELYPIPRESGDEG